MCIYWIATVCQARRPTSNLYEWRRPELTKANAVWVSSQGKAGVDVRHVEKAVFALLYAASLLPLLCSALNRLRCLDGWMRLLACARGRRTSPEPRTGLALQ